MVRGRGTLRRDFQARRGSGHEPRVRIQKRFSTEWSTRPRTSLRCGAEEFGASEGLLLQFREKRREQNEDQFTDLDSLPIQAALIHTC